jgi:hypothetical protein
MGVLESMVEDEASLQIDWDEEPSLRSLSKDCHEILGRLQEFKQHFDSVGTQTQYTWEREQWRADELAEIWTRLTTTVSSLNAVHRTFIQYVSEIKTMFGKDTKAPSKIFSKRDRGDAQDVHRGSPNGETRRVCRDELHYRLAFSRPKGSVATVA